MPLPNTTEAGMEHNYKCGRHDCATLAKLPVLAFFPKWTMEDSTLFAYEHINILALNSVLFSSIIVPFLLGKLMFDLLAYTTYLQISSIARLLGVFNLGHNYSETER